MSNKIVDHEDQVILTKESYKSMSVYVNESTNIDNLIPSLFLLCLYKLQGLSLQCLYKAILTIICLRCLYENTSTVVTYYHWLEFLYKCLYIKTFYIISTNASLRLCSYTANDLHRTTS